SAATMPSEEVSDDACPQGPTTSDGPITTTPAQTIQGGQEEQEPPISCALRSPLSARYTVVGLGRSTRKRGKCWRRRCQDSRHRTAERRSLSPGACARPAGGGVQ